MVKIDLTGKTFGKFYVMNQSPKKYPKEVIYYDCRCICGKEKRVAGADLKKGGTKSCGCFKKELCRMKAIKHGMFETPEHNSWHAICQRCNSPTYKDYYNYGGRGIKVCDEWKNPENGFQNFYDYIGPKPGPEYSVDRINNDGDYAPGNVRWATYKQQANNRRKPKKK